MANHINTLQQRSAERALLTTHALEAIADFRAHLLGPKFGPQADGERGDWIATSDVLSRLEELRHILQS